MYLEEWINTTNTNPFYVGIHKNSIGGGKTFLNDLKQTALIFNKNWFFGNNFLKFFLTKNYLSINGPRDIFWIVLAKILHKNILIFIQVPFKKKVKSAYSIYGILIKIFFFLIKGHACYSSSDIGSDIKTKLLYPISLRRVKLLKKAKKKVNPIRELSFAFRFTKEIGNPSKDLNQFKKMCMLAMRDKLIVNHYGPTNNNYIKSILKDQSLISYINFNGYHRHWQNNVKGVFVHLCNYEGFGLAPVETSLMGIPTYVNGNMPKSSWEVAPNMMKILKTDFWNI